MKVPDYITLSVEIDADSVDSLPTERRIFHFAVNESSKGPIIVDAADAAAVVEQFNREGVDLMIDLEHDSLSLERRALRSDAADARGWCRLEARPDGIWVTGMRWTPDGQDRLLTKKQRYLSPAFRVDSTTKRISCIINVALTSMPATYGAEPLVAASRVISPAGASSALKTRSKMDPEQVKGALDALESGDAAKALELLKAMIATAASNGEAAPETPGSTEALAECADPAPKPEDQKMLSRVVADLEKSSAEVVRLSRVVERLEGERSAAEAVERAGLVGDLVKLGVELPATAWADPEKRVPVARLASESIAELRSRVEAYRASGNFTRRELETPTITLSKAEADLARNMTPAQRAAYEALRASRKAR